MLVNMKDMLQDAQRNNYSIGCINTPTYDLLRGIVGAAEDVGAPIIIDHAEVHDPLIPVQDMAPLMLEVARRASVPVAVHIDHGMAHDFIGRGINAGFTSVMYDLSTLPFEENLARVKKFTEFAHSIGITVEAELGIMTSTLEDSHEGPPTPADIRETFTDPDQAKRFAEETGVDALAVCFGTAHGLYIEDPKLDLDHLDTLRAAVPEETALVMHGSSGVSRDQLSLAVEHGASKINYYSYLAVDASNFAKEQLNAATGPVFYHELQEATTAHIREYARDIIGLLANGKQPTIPTLPIATP